MFFIIPVTVKDVITYIVTYVLTWVVLGLGLLALIYWG